VTPAVRYLLDQLEVAVTTRNDVLAEHYLEELRRELDPTAETIPTQRHEAGRVEP
jgi:hypothetical protein